MELPEDSKVSIALDCWTSTNNLSFLAVMVYFIDVNWRYREVLLGFEHVSGRHTGVNLARIVKDILDNYRLTERVHAITTDNASNNGSMFGVLKQALISLPKGYHVPCLAHVIQLAVKELLSSIQAQASNDDFVKHWSDDLKSQVPSRQGFLRTMEKVSFSL